MAGQPQNYDQFLVIVDGQLLGEADSVEWRNENSGQDVLTLVKGFAGQTPGPHKTVASISGFVPAAGMEFNFSNAEQNDSFHNLQVIQRSGSQKASSDGVFRNFRASGGVGQNAKVDVEFHGTPGKFE